MHHPTEQWINRTRTQDQILTAKKGGNVSLVGFYRLSVNVEIVIELVNSVLDSTHVLSYDTIQMVGTFSRQLYI